MYEGTDFTCKPIFLSLRVNTCGTTASTELVISLCPTFYAFAFFEEKDIINKLNPKTPKTSQTSDKAASLR